MKDPNERGPTPRHARLPLSLHPWLSDPRVLKLFQALEPPTKTITDPPCVQFVGGVVRDALLGRPVEDMDLATTIPPLEVMERLHKAHIKAIPTGLSHGTVTAVIDGKSFEITTLRRDVETHGRHATVAFTKDWAQDAARRDFTMNALYADTTGLVTDYVGGLQDLEQGHLRFIGNAAERIEEDVLRILRYFRFQAWYGHTPPDSKDLAACESAREKMRTLSPERVWKEFHRLLAAPDPAPVLRLMAERNILQQILPEARHAPQLSGLIRAEKAWQIAPDPLRRLAFLLPSIPVCHAENAVQDLRLSNQEKYKLNQILDVSAHLSKFDKNLNIPPPLLHALLYEREKEAKRHAAPCAQSDAGKALLVSALLLRMGHEEKLDPQELKNRFAPILDTWIPPVFPLKGQDLLDLGLPAGPQIRAILEETENWWKSQNFTPTPESCRAHALDWAKDREKTK